MESSLYSMDDGPAEVDSDDNMEEKSTYDVFIAHSNDYADKRFVDVYLTPALKDRRFKVMTDETHFEYGTEVIPNITRAIRICKKTLIILTEASIKSVWCSFEMLLAFEESQKRNRMSVILLLLNPGPEMTMRHMRLFEMAPKVLVETDDGVLTSGTLDELVTKLRDEAEISQILPAGNVAHGQVWSHFTGLLQYMLPALDEKITESEWYVQNRDRFPIKLYELIPEDCVCPSKISDDTGRIKPVGSLPSIKCYRAGNERAITLPVYSITDDDGTVYYCVAEYPSVIGAIKKMEDENLSDLSKEDRRLQIGRFYYTMSTILTHPKMENCHNKAKLLPFNVKRMKPSDVLLSAIKVDLQLQEDMCERPLDRLNSLEPLQYDYDAYVSFFDDDQKNKEIADKIIAFLEKKALTICWNKGNQSLVYDRNIDSCRWFIIVLTKNALHNQLFSCQSLSVLTEQLNQRKINVIPVMDNCRQDNIPQALRAVTYVDARHDSRYLERLCHTVKGESIPFSVETHLPAGDVAYGLAWGYVVNYLQIILNPVEGKGFKERIEDVFKEKKIDSYVCPGKLFILVPHTCECKAKVSEDDERIFPFTSFKVTCVDQTGVIGREYSCDIYKIVGQNDQEYYFVGQYAAPVHCLWEMTQSSIAGLKHKEMLKESRRFCEIVRDILDGPLGSNVKEKCDIVQYNCSLEPLADSLVKWIARA